MNWSEVVQRILTEGDGRIDRIEGARVRLEVLGLAIEPFTREDALAAAVLRARTKHLGLSLADRVCLALAGRLGFAALTADRVWMEVPADLGLEVEQIR